MFNPIQLAESRALSNGETLVLRAPEGKEPCSIRSILRIKQSLIQHSLAHTSRSRMAREEFPDISSNRDMAEWGNGVCFYLEFLETGERYLFITKQLALALELKAAMSRNLSSDRTMATQRLDAEARRTVERDGPGNKQGLTQNELLDWLNCK